MEKAITVHRRVEEQLFRQLWNAILANNIYVICKTPMAVSITKRTLSGFTGANVNVVHIPLVPPAGSQGTALIADPNFDLQTTITKAFGVRYLGIGIRKDGSPDLQSPIPDSKSLAPNPQFLTMQFDIIIGNPPYQQADGGGGKGSSAKPLYHIFVQQAKKLNPQYISLIIPARWLVGGKGLDRFRYEMLNDERLCLLHDYLDSKMCFPNVSIEGGICYFLWKKNHTGKCKVFSHIGSDLWESERTLLSPYTDVFIRFPEQLSIVEKIRQQELSLEGKTFDTIVSVRKPFGLASDFREFCVRPFDGAVKIYANKQFGYVKRKLIERNTEWIDQWKVYITFAYGSGTCPFRVLNKPFLGEPNTCTTETNLVIGPFENKKTAENAISYIKTRFFRFLVSIKKITQNGTKDVYQLVPLQDFDESWTDAKLYKKYSLAESEIAFIEKMICEMV